MSKLNYLYLGLGSNLGDKRENINLAYLHIQEKIGNIFRKSAIYETPPWGFQSEDVFYNTVIFLETELTAEQVLEKIQEIEKELGRVKDFKIGYSSRVIDIDILDYNNMILEKPQLVLPHPHIEKRNFVLYPMRDIAENWQHPKSRINIDQLIENLDKSEVIKRLGF